MEVLSLNEVKSIDHDQQSEIINKIENKENCILICYDPNNDFNENPEDFKIRLHQINDSVIFHTELESCITFIQSITKEKIFIIIFGSSASQILPHITTLHQIDCIFIFTPRNDQYEHLLIEDSNIIGIYDNFHFLSISIKKQIDLANNRIPKWYFFDQVEYVNKDLSKQSSDFLWLQLFHAVLLHLPCDNQVKRQKIDTFHHSYQSNIKELKLIDEYQPNDAIRWFMKHLLLRKRINKALQTQDMNQLYPLKYFLSDLVQNLRHNHQRIVQSDRENLIVYREMKLSNDEFNQLKENKDKLISMRGFLIATTERSSTSSPKATHLISVLFQIECNFQELNNNFIFTDITELTNQQTILFDLNTTFRLGSIHQDEQMWIIKLNAVNDGEIITQKYIDDTRRQMEDLNIEIIFGKLICDMCQWDQSLKYFQQLFNDSHDEDLPWIEHSIGQAHHWKGEWNEAQKFYHRAYERMMHMEPVRIKDSAIVLTGIGKILYLQGQYEEAFDYYQRSLTIQNKYHSSHHIHIATNLENIGLILQKRLKDDEALIFFQQALIIREKYYNYFHVDIAMSLNNIACNLSHRKKYDEALVYYQRAMSIYRKYYPSGHVHIATILDSIGDVLYRQDKIDEGLDIIQQALTMQKKFYPSGHIDIAVSLVDIGNIQYDQGKYDESLELHMQALTMLTKYYPSGHVVTVFILNNIGDTQVHAKENCDEALRFHKQALTMLETCYPSYLGHIAITLNYIGNVLSKQEKNDEALSMYNRSLKMQEEYYLSDHIEIVLVLRNVSNTLEDDEVVKLHEQALIVQKKNGGASGNVNMASSLNEIGKILHKQNKYDEALNFYQRSLMIREEFDPSNHALITTNLSNIGRVLVHQKKYEEAYDFEQRALNIRETHNPSNHMRIFESFNQMGNVRFHQEKYDEAYNLFQQALTIYDKHSLSHHADIVFTLMRVGNIKYNQRIFDEALDYYHRAVDKLKEFHPTDYTQLIYGLEWIGFILVQKQSYDRAIEYYEKCLQTSEASYSPGHLSIVDILSKFGQVQRIHHQYKHSLTYELKSFLMLEKGLPPDHQDIGKALGKIGMCYEDLNQFNLALDYYKRALVVYEQCLSSENQERSLIELKIEQLLAEMEPNNI